MVIRLRGAAQQISKDMVAFDRHAAFDVAHIDAFSGEPAAVKVVRACSKGSWRGGKPSIDCDGGAFIQKFH